MAESAPNPKAFPLADVNLQVRSLGSARALGARWLAFCGRALALTRSVCMAALRVGAINLHARR